MGARGRPPAKLGPTLAQGDALRHLGELADGIPACPQEVTAKAAVRELLGNSVGYVAETLLPGKISTVYQRGKVSLPKVRGGTVSRFEVSPELSRHMLLESYGLVLPLEQRDVYTGKLAFDVRLRKGNKVYGDFLGDLYSSRSAGSVCVS